MTIRPVYSTMGQQSPATVADDAGRTGGYLYKKDPQRTPDHPDYVPLADREPERAEPLPQNKAASAEKQRKFAEYTRLRLAGVPKAEAAAQVGIKPSTARDYEGEFKALHPEAAP